LERSELGGSRGCPIHSAPSLGQSIVKKGLKVFVDSSQTIIIQIPD